MTRQEFAQRLKTKYPQWSKIDDETLVDSILERYPMYRSQIGVETVVEAPSPEPLSTSRLSDLGQDIKQTGSSILGRLKDTWNNVTGIQKRQQAGETGVASGFLQSMGAVSGGASNILGDVVTGLVKAGLSPEQEQKVKSFAENVVTKAVQLPPIEKSFEAYQQLKQTNPELARNLEATFNIGMLAADVFGSKTATKLLGRAAETGTKLAQRGVSTAVDVGSQTLRNTEPLLKKAIGTPTALKAAGEILQSTTEKATKQGIRGLAELNTAGIKTFKELGDAIKSKINDLVVVVDEDLGKDTTKRLLDNWILKESSQSGAIIESNPVKTALSQLEELYEKIGDNVQLANVRELVARANSEGLTKLEINDIARVYGTEFGTKAFSKTGEALTSVNARMYENVRRSLKELSREGIVGKIAKQADEAMSNLFETQRLIEKNIKEVTRLRNKISEMGLLQKLGHYLTKATDLATGGFVRGVIGGLLPRGVGYKTMNALDLEKVLKRNLEILQEAINSNSDVEITNILKRLK